MKSHFRPKRVLSIAALTLAWCALWGNFSFANALSGIALTVLVTSRKVATPNIGAIRLVPLLKLSWLILVDLAKSTYEVAAEILTPTDRTDESIVAITLPLEARDHLLLLVSAITLTPGTAVVDADPDTGVLYLHLLHDRRREETIAHAHELAALACEALPLSAHGGTT